MYYEHEIGFSFYYKCRYVSSKFGRTLRKILRLSVLVKCVSILYVGCRVQAA